MGAALSIQGAPDKPTRGRRGGRALALGVLLLAVGLGAPGARAQASAPEALLGLPLVVQAKGWARYAGTSADGPSTFVVRVGEPGRYDGQRGRWILLEVDVPGAGRVGFDFLVRGERFGAKDVLLLRLRVPGHPPRDTPAPFDAPSAERAPRLLRRTTQTVAGRKLTVTEYSSPPGLTAGWSPEVPGLGLVAVDGTRSFHLEAFGVGGDPWKGAPAP